MAVATAAKASGSSTSRGGFQVSKVLLLLRLCRMDGYQSQIDVTLSVKSVPIAALEPDLWSRRVVKEHVKETRTRLVLNTRTRSCP